MEWRKLDHHPAVSAPWEAEIGDMKLFCQPYYGDGVYYRGIIKHQRWTLTLSENFRTVEVCQRVTEKTAEKLRASLL